MGFFPFAGNHDEKIIIQTYFLNNGCTLLN